VGPNWSVMTERGRLRDTYVAAIQHDKVDLAGDEHLVGVVRRPHSWFHGQVDENRPALAPPEELLEEFKERASALEAEGHSGRAAHNEAWDAVDFDARYRRQLSESPDAREAMTALTERLAAGDDVVLVCYENTDEKRCHRTLLRDELEPVPR
jgi:uncharacterized protein YeaO (DUF488 family)